MQLIDKKKLIPIIATVSLAFIAIFIYIILKFSNTTTTISGKEFNNILKNNQIESIYLQDNYIVANTKNGNFKVFKDAVNRSEIFKKYPIKVYTKSSKALTYIAILILLSILSILIYMLRRDKSIGINLQPQFLSKEIEENSIKPEYNNKYKFKDIAGISDVKEQLLEIIDFLKNPHKYKKRDIRMPKGVLLIGPPGVGKTLIAKAISAEANVPFFYNSGASFVQIYAGMGAKKVRELFEKAKEMAPSIIFIDEIDAVGKSRDALDSNERESTLNQLLVEMDGFGSNSGVIVIGATNRIDVLDSALLRAGRFDRRVFIDLPNIKEREQIINHYLNNKKYNIDIAEVARLTAGFSPAAIETLINEAALNALRKNRDLLEIDDIYSVKDQVVYGKKRVVSLSNQERQIQANYQASKAVIATWLGFKFDKATLLMPIHINDDRVLISKNRLINLAKVYLSGVIYLQKKYNDTFSVSKDDKKLFENIIETIIKDYTISNDETKQNINKDIEIEITTTLSKLSAAIEYISNELNKKEIITYNEIKKSIDEVL